MKKINLRTFLAIFFIFIFLGNNSYAYVREMSFNNKALPSYYTKEWLNNTYNKVKTNVEKGNTSFVFITDVHYSHNSGYSPALINNITSRVNNNSSKKINFVVNGGDTFSNDNTDISKYSKKQIIDQYNKNNVTELNNFKKFNDSIKKSNFANYYIRGNHDFNIFNINDTSIYTKVNEETTYKTIMSAMDKNKIKAPNNKLYYYFDDTKNKIRYIMLDVFEYNGTSLPDTYISNEQVNWFYNVVRQVNDYNIVIFSHAAVSGDVASGSSKNIIFFQEIEEALNNRKKYTGNINGTNVSLDFTKNTNTIIAHFSGHTHRDLSSYKNGVLSISTTSDFYAGYKGDGMWKRTQGTTTEQAFDIITIDTSTKKIYATRVGAGRNRAWTWNNNSITNDISKCKIQGITTQYYTGKDILLDLTVKSGNKTLTKDVDYTVNYKNNKSVGEATVTITGKGKYNGTNTQKFLIIKKADFDSNKEYYITSGLINGRAIDGKDGLVNYGNNAVIRTLSCRNTQKYKLVKYNDDTYRIQNVEKKTYLQAYAGDISVPKTYVMLVSTGRGDYSKWYIGQNNDGTISFYTPSGLAMTVIGEKNNDKIQINTFMNSKSQRFNLKSTDQISYANINTNYYYTIVSKINNSKAIDLYAGKASDFNNIDIYDYNKTDAQIFRFQKNADGSYTIINKGAKKAIDVFENRINNKTNIDIYSNNNTTAQKWYIIKNSDGTISFLGAESGRAISLNDSKTQNFNNIHILDWNGTRDQKWKLVKH